MSILTSILLALQIVSMAITGVQQIRPMLQPQAQQQAAPPAIPSQPGDRIRYWYDQQRGQWLCEKNGTVYFYGPVR